MIKRRRLGDVEYGRRRTSLLKSAIVVSALSCNAAQPQVFRCTDADGHVVFSDTSCGSTSEKVKVVESSGGLSQINGDGLSSQEKGDLGAIDARDAQIASQRSQAGGSPQGGSAAPAPAPAAAPAPHRGY